MNEAETRAELIDPLLAEAGWGVVEGSRIRREFSIPRQDRRRAGTLWLISANLSRSASCSQASSGSFMNRPADAVQLKGRASASTAWGSIHMASP